MRMDGWMFVIVSHKNYYITEARQLVIVIFIWFSLVSSSMRLCTHDFIVIFTNILALARSFHSNRFINKNLMFIEIKVTILETRFGQFN